MSYLLPHLHSGFAVDQAILSVSLNIGCAMCCVIFCTLLDGLAYTLTLVSLAASLPPLLQEEDRVVILRFGHDWDETCMQMDEVRRRHPPSSHVPLFLLTCGKPLRCTDIEFPFPFHTPSVSRLQVLASVAEKIKNFAVVYLVDVGEVPDFNAMYELYDPCTVMFFFRNKVRGSKGDLR